MHRAGLLLVCLRVRPIQHTQVFYDRQLKLGTWAECGLKVLYLSGFRQAALD